MVSAAEEAGGAETCALCGSATARPLATGYDRTQARAADYLYVQCASCSLVRLSPLPRSAELEGFYPDDYGPHAGRVRRDDRKLINRLAIRYLYAVDSPSRSPLLRAVFRAVSGRLMSALREPTGRNRVLDVGCGSGTLLVRYRALGWTVRGIEMDPRACAVAHERGLDVHCGTVFDAPFDGEFDVILLHHVIEHVLDPVGVLQRIRNFLAPGGIIEVETPNIDSLGFAWYGSCWYALDAPRHLMLFNPRTLRTASERAALTVRSVKTVRSTTILRRSHHYAVTQGRALPTDLGRRAEVVAASMRAVPPYRLYRALVGPLTRAAAAVGRGEVLEAELGR